MATEQQPLQLYTFTISHFSEKIRWLLDAAGIAYVERPLTPGLHMPRTLWLGRKGTSVPILHADGERVQDSRRIVRWLAEHRGLGRLLPADAQLREQALAIEAAQNAVGTAVMRVVYEQLIEQPELLFQLWTLDSSPLEKRLLRAVLPGLRKAFRRRFGLDAAGIASAQATVARRLDALDTQLADGRRHLVGEQFTVADLATSALLAPLAAPDWHPIYGATESRTILSEQVRGWQSRPALQWVRACYRDHRPATRGGGSLDAARAKLVAA